jgi:light-regulated signal transduction histidine kinase (bacteriophytochrome)
MNAPEAANRQALEAHVAALEQLLQVYEQTVAEQSQKLDDALNQLNAQAVELKRSNEELEQFAYVASHDLQEPLRMVASYTQLLERRYGDKLDDNAREFIAFAVDGARRMQALIDALLQYSRVGSRAGEMAQVDLNEVLDAARINLTVAIEEAQAEVIADKLPSVVADQTQMIQLFQNLIGNAIKFRGEQRPCVHVSATPESGRVHVVVKDNGIGIDPRYANRIFMVFQRLHTQAEYPGTGIGLALCRKIVERHGGAIWVESEPGKGAAFHFTLANKGQTS